MFFALAPQAATLADTNADVINLYRQVKDRPQELMNVLTSMHNSESDYYLIRSQHPEDPVTQAARILYLSNLSFNGIHRVNLRGEFNVPYGHKYHHRVFDAEHLLRASSLLNGKELLSMDFERAVSSATRGDVVYFDPPYTILHGSNGFVKYNERIFSWKDQERLARSAHQLAGDGVTVIVSNADHCSVRSLYDGFDSVEIRRASQIAADGTFRRPVTERLFVARGY